MGFRFYRRINMGNGFGLNVSKSGVGASLRGKYGAIGSSGFSIRTGIPGLGYRQGWGKRGQGALAVVAIVACAMVAAAIVVVTLRLLVLLAVFLWQGIQWCVLTAQDYLEYRRTGQQSGPAITGPLTEDGALIQQHQEKTLAEIIEETGGNASSVRGSTARD